jgi:hypothetical protein
MGDENDLIIGCSTNYDWSKLKYWINSINMSGFKGEKVLILMNCDRDTVQKINGAGFKVVGFNRDEQGNLKYESRIPVHVERFIHIYNYIDPTRHRNVITTDVKDVIFQKDPGRWFRENIYNGKNLIFASESIRYKNEPWGDQNLRETFGQFIYDKFKDNEIYNVGVLAGRAQAMKDLCMNIFAATMGKPIAICDQSTFNFLIAQHPYTDTSIYYKSEDGWAAQLGTTGDPTKVQKFKPYLLEPCPKFENEILKTSKGTEFCIVHQYDRVPAIAKIIEKKYG